MTSPSPEDTSEGDEPGSTADADPEEPQPPPQKTPVPADVRPPQSRLHVTSTVSIGESDVRWIESSLGRAISHLPQAIDSLSVIIIDDSAMADMHAHHLGEHSTTDVITFDLRGNHDPALPIDCEIYICIDEAKRQAAKRDWPAVRELLLYALHGLLHCCGFNDHDPADFARMHAEEDRILAAIGIGATFLGQGRGLEDGV